MLVGVIAVQVRPIGNGSTESITVPVKPFTTPTLIVTFAYEPMVLGVGDDVATVKSANLNVAFVECISGPLPPVIISM